ncbi:NADP oxidoreductase [Rathayibacter rathayi]|uniref:NADPH-dependent F420 reductase n=1 Tax=Rathayibacter rathayi TaxID=33887 RepID=UPI000CE921D6|nr:NADP oxidoreductase [Rathayibacter rathayi]PPG44579.1 NADP oxidoreductase [Rathayibacter rathayi]PPG71203.1 NADP oxidoreductase [Rathayibacter rathayi]PPG78370.1 NADP oxidoreductase [Rathayibacter rathayi]PPG88635.1 NADP oxidoreductase [Rathayibacter rathayi]PPG97196.1 NADP oxidoreductase [Rathayibacter rathayi]
MSVVAIIGDGNVGGALARAACRSGNDVQQVTRKTPREDAVAALAGADLVVLALPYRAALELAPDQVAALAGKTVLDATNPLSADFARLTVGFSTSGGEQIAAHLGRSKVVKALNAVLAPNHDPASFEAGSLFVPVAGDDEEAKARVLGFLVSLGFDAVDVGPLQNARYIEPFAELLVQLAYFKGKGTAIGVSLLRA